MIDVARRQGRHQLLDVSREGAAVDRPIERGATSIDAQGGLACATDGALHQTLAPLRAANVRLHPGLIDEDHADLGRRP